MTKPQLQTGLPGRNDPCSCGSGKKYKKCCAGAETGLPNHVAANQSAKTLNASIAWQTAVQAFEAGNLALAQVHCETALTLNPQMADALQLRAMIAFRQQGHQTALNYIQLAIRQAPHSSIFYNSLGTIQQALGQYEEAEKAYRKALQFDPNSAIVYHNLGDLWHSQARVQEAEQCYREAIRLQPNFPEAHNNLGLILLESHQYDQAIAHLAQAIQLRPDYLKAHYTLSRALRERGRITEAQAVLEQAVRLKPDFGEAWHDLGLCLLAQEKPQEALAFLEKSVQLKPDLDRAHLNIGNIYYERGLADMSMQHFRQAQTLRPTDGLALKMALCVPAIYDSIAHVQAERERITADLDRLEAANLQITDPYEEVALTPFYLGYQGENEVENLSRIGDLFLQACPALGFTAPHCLEPRRDGSPLKIGFISSSFVRQNHIVNRVIGGLITNWPRDQFAVILLHRNMPCGEIVQKLRDGDRLVRIPNALDAARQRIADEKLDILFYCDLGMEPWTYFLALARLAPLQVTSGGHPITSGVPTIDYFLSSAIEEVPHAQQHYRERLLALPQRPVCYFPATPPAQPKTRADLGLPEQGRIYLCPMTPFKLHPRMDQLIGEILRTDTEGKVFFVVNSQTELWERLKQRFARTLPDVYSRLCFLPFMLMPDFIELLQQADVLLDTISFGSGTTALEAFAVGTPIITLPGQLLRQRGVFGMYKQMEMPDCIAQDEADYVRLATQIARSPEQREHLKQQILARNSVLFGQTDWISQISDFLLQAITKLP